MFVCMYVHMHEKFTSLIFLCLSCRYFIGAILSENIKNGGWRGVGHAPMGLSVEGCSNILHIM